MTYAKIIESTPGQMVPAAPGMIQNAAGGYVFALSDAKRLQRFLILGSEGNTYYEKEQKLTLENAVATLNCIKQNGMAVVDEAVRVSDLGLAPKNDSAIFVLAMASKFGNDDVRKYALTNLPKVCRISTHLFQFAQYREALGAGWGRAVRTAVGNWYRHRNVPSLAMQVLKYRQRDDWSHRDILRLTHPKPLVAGQKEIFDAICRPEKWAEVTEVSPLIDTYVRLQKATSAGEVAKLIKLIGAPREFVPTQFLTDKEVWDALLQNMPITAMIRNLGNMSKAGLLVKGSEAETLVKERLQDVERIQKARVHPWAVMLATKVYEQGKGHLGKGAWPVSAGVVKALDATFNLSFRNVRPTGKKYLLAVDVSGSMGGGYMGSSALCPRDAAACMALITARVEEDVTIMGFATNFVDLKITKEDSLPTVIKKMSSLPFGGTDTSVAVKWAMKNGHKFDVIGVYTDSETWAGNEHTFKAMETYRKATGHPTKLAVLGFTATARTIAHPEDTLSMDFVGMSADLPQALNCFVLEG